MFNKRNPSKKELAAQHAALLEILADMGLRPDDVPQAMQELHNLIISDIKRIGHYDKPWSAVSILRRF